MATSQFLTAKQAAAALGITRATLYAYTSRGQLRSEPVPGQTRERRYHREDVERLKARTAGGGAGTLLGRARPRVGHYAHSRRDVLLPRTRRRAAGRVGSRGGRGSAV